MSECGPTLRMPFFPPTLVKYATGGGSREKSGVKRAHLEVGTVPQQVLRAPIPSVVPLKQRGTRAREPAWNPVRFWGPRGPHGPLLHYTGLD